MDEGAIVFFDEHCVLCNRLVRFLSTVDSDDRLRFASLTSETADRLLGVHRNLPDSVVVLVGVQIAARSEAVLLLARTLGGIWRVAEVIRLIPHRWRDRAYVAVARRRYRWFGRHEHCPAPSVQLRTKILP
jgi:predicted DCC family thiol-disulfide oxidoreductase YuxK